MEDFYECTQVESTYTAPGGTRLTNTELLTSYDEKGGLFGFVRKSDGAEYFYRRDAQGNVIAILDNIGIVVVEYKYDAWGNHKVLSPDGAEITDETHLGYLNPHRYRGYYYSDVMGLYYLKSRFYDPAIGRFISADSLDYLDPHTVGGVNLFAYCNNNPVMNVDPLGHAWWNPMDWDWKKLEEISLAVAKVAVSVAAVTVLAAASVVTGGVAGVVLAGAAVGASVGMAGGAIGAAAAGGGIQEIASGMLSGTITGAVSGAIAAGPLGTAGQIVANAGLGAINYTLNQSLNGESVTLGGVLLSAGLGAVAGAWGGNGWQNGTKLGLNAASLTGNGFQYGLSLAGSRSLSRMIFPPLLTSLIGGIISNSVR